ncbi:MAG TPA: alpha/beta fold hydrolase [Pyrinomonadaceae bacterium]|nr:alpha/beta fold hydrolase [Pyrinomonadaceae bacterium]
MKIPFEESAGGEKPIVLLHAFPLSRKMWQMQIEALADAGFRVILPDLRGFGENHNFADINSMEDLATDVKDLMDNLKIERAIIGGLSMGGYVTFNFYRLFPERFAGLLLFDTNPAADSEEKRQSRFDLIDEIEKSGAQALIDGMLPKLIGDWTKENNADLVEKLRAAFASVNPQAAIAALRGMAERQDHTALLKDVNVPTLLIFGEDDNVTSPEIAEKMKSEIPGATLTKIKNAGHYSNLEQPEAFNDALVSFVRLVDFK